MKELTTEEKAKRYDEAIEIAKEINNEQRAQPFNVMIRVFPELKEDEDEKILKGLVDYFKDFHLQTFAGLDPKKILAWLEKQGNPTNINPSEFDLRLNKLLKQFETLSKEELANSLSFYLNVVQNDGTYREEKQGGQKLYVNDNAKEMFIKALERVEEQNNKGYKLTDCDKNSWWEDFKAYISYTIEQNVDKKEEQKFKVGEWIITPDNQIKQIKSISFGNYHFTDGSLYNIIDVDNKGHLWTIEKAKDGDVLLCEGKHGQEIGIVKKYIGKYSCDICFETYCYVDWDGIFRVGEYMSGRNIHPVTKEQRDALKKAITNNGYRWDKEKLKLEKI